MATTPERNDCDDELLLFWEILAKGYCSSTPLIEILGNASANLAEGELRDVVEDLTAQSRQNIPLHEAMAKHPTVFSRAHIALVEGGNRLGMLDRVLPFIVEATWRCPTCGNLKRSRI